MVAATSTVTGSGTWFSVRCTRRHRGALQAGQAYVIFGRASFPATFNLTTLNGTNGFTVNGAVANDYPGRIHGGRGR